MVAVQKIAADIYSRHPPTEERLWHQYKPLLNFIFA
jgi:hypothetical protein